MDFSFNEQIFDHFPVLESERLRYRSFSPADTPAYLHLRSDPRIMEFVDAVYTTTEAEALQKIQGIQNDFLQHHGINWVITTKENDLMIGYIGFWRLMKENLRAEIGYLLDDRFWGQGYMHEACETILDFGFHFMNLHSVEANVNVDNKRCIKLLDRLGFVKEAHFRENYLFKCRFLDSLIYSLLESDFKGRRI
ncbi:MAG: GNAT family N-acetyltransferase [Prolixibacteraceae bacterium]|nr:GNAT family N-acetyltransferase [Prolixibacteraceae bacterium]